MTFEEAVHLRTEAGQPLEWPEEIGSPLSRTTLTRLILMACVEQDLAVSDWEIPLLKPERVEEDTDYAFGDGIAAVVDSVLCERLGGDGGWQPGADLLLGHLIIEIELAFLEWWQALVAVADPEAGALAAIGEACGRSVTAQMLLNVVIPADQLLAFCGALAQPWSTLMPPLRHGHPWWLRLWGQSVWPEGLATVGDLAHLLGVNLQHSRAHLVTVEREFGS